MLPSNLQARGDRLVEHLNEPGRLQHFDSANPGDRIRLYDAEGYLLDDRVICVVKNTVDGFDGDPEPRESTLCNPTLRERVRAAGRRALRVWGREAQTNMVLEELGELSAAINRHRRKRADDAALAEEIADVLIVCEQIRELAGPELVDAAVEAKLARLEGRLAKTGDTERYVPLYGFVPDEDEAGPHGDDDSDPTGFFGRVEQARKVIADREAEEAEIDARIERTRALVIAALKARDAEAAAKPAGEGRASRIRYAGWLQEYGEPLTAEQIALLADSKRAALSGALAAAEKAEREAIEKANKLRAEALAEKEGAP